MTSEILPIGSRIRQFAPGVKDQIRAHFPDAEFTIIPARETPRSLEKSGVMRFDYAQGLNVQRGRARFRLTTDTQVVYRAQVLAGSFVRAFNEEEEDRLRMLHMLDPFSERRNAQAVISRLDKIPGVRWIIPSRALVARIVVGHLQKYDEQLLKRDSVWTSDQMESFRDNHPYLVVGHFDGERLLVDYLTGEVGRSAGILLVGVPDRLSSRRAHLHLVQR